MGIGERLRAARGLAKVAARELDRLAGRTPGHCGLIENRPDADAMAGTLAAYAEVLGVSLDWLIVGKAPEPDEAAVVAAVRAARARVNNEAA